MTDTLQIKLDHDLVKALHANSEAQKLGVPEFISHAV